MYYGAIKKYDIANGVGVRVSLFVSGCTHRCKGCFNPETWDFEYGNVFDKNASQEVLEALSPDYISGLTVLGGEPLHPANIKSVYRLCMETRLRYPDKSIWIYTGYTYETIKDYFPQILEEIDVLVDGRFIEEQKDITLKFKGSANQRIIDVQASIKSEELVLWEGER